MSPAELRAPGADRAGTAGPGAAPAVPGGKGGALGGRGSAPVPSAVLSPVPAELGAAEAAPARPDGGAEPRGEKRPRVRPRPRSPLLATAVSFNSRIDCSFCQLIRFNLHN